MKSVIRREMVARRNSLTHEEVMEKSAMIQKRVLELPIYQESSTIGLYASFNNEVSTSLIFDEALKDRKQVLFPCIRRETKDLVFFPVQGRDELELGPFGVMVPSCRNGGGSFIEEADLLLIPGVCYDTKGGRLGYGGGFYDRSLGKVVELPFIAALAYEFQILDEVPMHQHDIRVDAIITEQRVIICNLKTANLLTTGDTGTATGLQNPMFLE